MARSELSERELPVLQYIANGRKNKEIAELLHVSKSTVKAYVSSILKKLNAIGRTEAIVVATRRGLLRVNSNQLTGRGRTRVLGGCPGGQHLNGHPTMPESRACETFGTFVGI
jgi:DNA-binding CsgD family transcriptional regulator